MSPRGKHAAPRRWRSTLLPLFVVACIAVLGSSVLLRSVAQPSAADQAQMVSGTSTPVARLFLPGIERLVVYGHSMAVGKGASDPSLSYAALVADAAGLQLVNRAEGRTIAAAAARAMADSRAAGPQDAVVIHTGINDLFRHGDEAVTLGREALRQLLSGTAGAGHRVVVLECQPASWLETPPSKDLQAELEAWNRMVREMATLRPDLELLDTCEAWDADRYNDDSRYHPNDEGHALIAEALVGLLAIS